MNVKEVYTSLMKLKKHLYSTYIEHDKVKEVPHSSDVSVCSNFSNVHFRYHVLEEFKTRVLSTIYI